MSVYKEKKFHLLVLLTVVALLVVWNPWENVTPAARGLPLGVDTSGGSAVLLEFRTSIVNFKTTSANLDETWDSIVTVLSPYWDLNLITTEEDENLIRFEIGGRVTQTYLNTYIGTFGQIENIEEGKWWKAGELTLRALQRRIDTYGLEGTRFRMVGDNYILVETRENVDEIERLLTKSGRLELFVQDVLAVAPNEIIGLGKISESGGYGLIPTYFTENGENDFNEAVFGKAGKSVMVYLDRPFDAVIIFKPDLLDELATFVYDNDNYLFKENVTEKPIVVTAFPSDPTQLSENVRQYLVSHEGNKLRVILLGSREDFSEGFLEAIPNSYTYELLEQKSDESADEWVARACGFISSFPIPTDIAENGITKGGGINIPIPGGLDEARIYQSLILHEVPVKVSEMKTATIEARYGTNFVNNGLLACLVGLVGIAFLSVRKYKQHDVGAAVLLIGVTNFIIMLGLFVATGVAVTAGQMVFLTGIYFICLLHQFLITREMLVGIAPGDRVKVGWRIPKALNPVYLGSAISIFMIIALGGLGVFVIWGTAVILTMLLILNALLVGPIYARILEGIILRSGRKEQ